MAVDFRGKPVFTRDMATLLLLIDRDFTQNGTGCVLSAI